MSLTQDWFADIFSILFMGDIFRKPYTLSMNPTATDFYRVNEARFISQEDNKADVYLTILKRYHDSAQRSV